MLRGERDELQGAHREQTPMKTLFLPLLALVSAAVSGCNNDCDFFERCSGDERQVCGGHPSQVVNREIHRYPCAEEAPNSACVELDDDHARCVLPEKTTCDDSLERRCDGDVLLTCSDEIGYSDSSNEPPRYLVGVPCADDGRTCVDYGNDASCVEDRR